MDVETLIELLEYRAAETPDKTAFTFDERPCTFRQMWDAVNRFAAYLLTLEIDPGDRVVVVLPNSHEFFFAFYGVQRTGAIAVPVFPGLGPPHILSMARLCRARFPTLCRTDTYCERDGTPRSMCVLPARADKGTALSLVLERLGLQKERTLAIGDNINDLPMFGVAGTSVAVGNALEQVKRCASAVAPSHDEEGVAWALERFVFAGERSIEG